MRKWAVTVTRDDPRTGSSETWLLDRRLYRALSSAPGESDLLERPRDPQLFDRREDAERFAEEMNETETARYGVEERDED